MIHGSENAIISWLLNFRIRMFKRRRSLTISQALCLLWHNQDSGEVPGRKSSASLYGNVTAAALDDMYVLRKIDFQDVPVTCVGVKYKSIAVKVNSCSQ